MPSRRLVLGSVFLAATVTAGLGGCSKPKDEWPAGVSVRVLTTIPPLACFVRNVAGPHAGVRCLCAETGPHQYEYNIGDTQLLRHADLFLANGLGLDEAFAEKMANAIKSSNARLHYVELGEGLPKDLLLKGEEHEEDKDEKFGHDHKHGEHDPHVWLGIPQAVQLVEAIRDELKKADAAHAADYDANADRYVKTLRELQAYGQKVLEGKKDRRLISFHESLHYFAKSFDLEIVDVIEEGPGNEPTGPKLAQLVKLCVDKKVRVIAVEPQYPTTTSAQVLLKELKNHGVTDMRLIEIDPMETGEGWVQDSAWYEAKTRANIDGLARQLP